MFICFVGDPLDVSNVLRLEADGGKSELSVFLNELQNIHVFVYLKEY